MVMVEAMCTCDPDVQQVDLTAFLQFGPFLPQQYGQGARSIETQRGKPNRKILGGGRTTTASTSDIVQVVRNASATCTEIHIDFGSAPAKRTSIPVGNNMTSETYPSPSVSAAVT